MSDGTEKAALGYEHTLVSFLFPYYENNLFLFMSVKISDIPYFFSTIIEF